MVIIGVNEVREFQNQAPYGLPFGRMPSGPMDARSISPTYAAFVMQQAAQTMSPSFEMYRNFPFGPASPSSLFQVCKFRLFNVNLSQ